LTGQCQEASRIYQNEMEDTKIIKHLLNEWHSGNSHHQRTCK
jgi:hypothetical protein